MAASEAASRTRFYANATKAAVAAAVLIGVLVIANRFRTADAQVEAQEGAYNAAVMDADGGRLDDALTKLETLIVSNPDPAVSKKANAKRDEIKSAIARRSSDAAKRRSDAIAELIVRQQAAGASARYEAALANLNAFLANDDFAAAVDEAKRFALGCPEGEHHDRMAGYLKLALAKANAAWDELQDRANALTKAEKYTEAVSLLASTEERFSGTRFSYEVRDKIGKINRLAGLNTAYASGAVELSAQAQESMLAVNDLVKARRYEAALKSFDKVVGGMAAKDRAAFAARRADISGQGAIFSRLVAAINAGELKDFAIDLGGNVEGRLSQASDSGVTMEFQDASGKGGTTGRHWFQVPASEMLSYFRQLKLGLGELLGLASFCYDNRLKPDGADILEEIARAQPGMEKDVFAFIARVRGIGVPSDGFVYFERGWFTKTEYTYAKLDYRAKKGAQLIAKIEEKPTQDGYAIYREMTDDGSLTPEFKQTVKGYYVAALKEKRQAIMKSLQSSQNIANYNALRDLKKELNRRRAEALRIIYDKTIYPDENHGVEGQPTVNDAVELVKEMWNKPLKVVARLDVGIKMLVEAGQQTNQWLEDMGGNADKAELEEYELLLANINESLNLKNICLDSGEKAIREYNKKVWEYNKKNEDTQMSGVELECVKITNEYREMMGRMLLEVDDKLGKCARKHSQEMVDLAYFAHESPTPEMRTPSDRAKKEGYVGGCGENICTGYGSAQAAFDAWYNSSGHHRNMLSDGWNHIGLGCVGGSMWTENLGRSTSHVGGTAETKKPAGGESGGNGGSRRGIGDGEKKPASPGGGESGRKPEEKKDGQAAGAKPQSPYKQPEGKCTGEAPYDERKDRPQGEDPAPVPADGK